MRSFAITILLQICFTYVYAQCDSSLWYHVYNPTRLIVREDCKTITGSVHSLFYANDGDIHIRIRLDREYEWMLNSSNRDDQYNCLVVEPICARDPVYTSAKISCAGHVNTVYTPNVGEHVAVTGPYVTDYSHGWNELHPVSKIEVVPVSVNTVAGVVPGVTLYPNPADNYVNFTLSAKPSETVYITILDKLGRLAGQYQMLETTELKVNLRSLPSGAYFYHVEQAGRETATGKLIIR